MPDLSTLDLSCWEILLRFLCAMTVGLVIGTEREYTGRPAGMRTHTLVSLGSCSVMILSQLLFAQYAAYGALPDPARLGAQVISGVGFLGAGTILREGTSIKGLTTAASVWTVACLGLAAGAGYYFISLCGMLLILLTLTALEWVQNKVIAPHGEPRNYCAETDDVPAALRALTDCAEIARLDLKHLLAEKAEDGSYRVTFRCDIGGERGQSRREKFFEAVMQSPGIKSIRELPEEK